MEAGSQQPKGQESAISALNTAIKALSVAEKTSSVAPAKPVFRSVTILLTLIRDSTVDRPNYVELGLLCADICQALDRGTNGKKMDDLSQSMYDAISGLTVTVADIQRKVVKWGKRNSIFRRFYAKKDKETIATWRLDLCNILRVFNKELAINTDTTTPAPRPDVTTTGTGVRINAVDTNTVTTISDSRRDALKSSGNTRGQEQRGMVKAKMSGIVSERRPYINVDSAGVGNLVHQNQEDPTSEHEEWSIPQTRGSPSQQAPHVVDRRSRDESYVRGKSEPTGTQVFARSSPAGTTGPDLADAVYRRLLESLIKYVADPQVGFPSGTCIPQRLYCQGTTIPNGATGKVIMFAMVDGKCFPATLALAGHCDNLVDSSDVVFTELNHTINLRIEWPGYDGWGAQIRTVNYQMEPKGITRAKLVKEIAKQLEKFIEKMKTVPIDPTYAQYRVGPEGIELRHIHIASLEQVSRGSWQPRFIYSGQ